MLAEYVSKIVPRGSTPDDWLSQFLALRDVTQFVIGTHLQYAADREVHDFLLEESSMLTRNAVFNCLESMKMPQYLVKMDLITIFSDMFHIILSDTPNLPGKQSIIDSPLGEVELDSLDALCQKLNSRRIIQRAGDRELVHNISEITRNVSLLDDPSGQFKSIRPGLYAVNCRSCHLIGYSQLKNLDKIVIPVRIIMQ